MYHQIAHNKRNSIVLVALFLLVWLLAGFVIGEFGGGLSTAIAGSIVLGLLGIAAAAYSYYFGAATVLAAGGARGARDWRDRRDFRPDGGQRRTDHADGAVSAAGIAGGGERCRADPKPAGLAERVEEDRAERQADGEVQPCGGGDVHRQPEGASRQLLQPPLRQPPADRRANRRAGKDRSRTANLMQARGFVQPAAMSPLLAKFLPLRRTELHP